MENAGCSCSCQHEPASLVPRAFLEEPAAADGEGAHGAGRRGRVQLHATQYRHASDGDGRGWLTIDGSEVAEFCRFRASGARGRLAAELRAVRGATDYRDPSQQAEYHDAHTSAGAIVHRQGRYTQFEFYDALEKYLSLPVEAALDSDKMPIRALAVVDARLCKRRLRTLRLRDDEHPLVRELFALRRAAERIGSGAPEG